MIIRSSPRPIKKRQNQYGLLLRRYRVELNWTQRKLTEELHNAGWVIKQSAIAHIESGKRTLLDYELKFFLDVLGKSWADIASDHVELKHCPKPQGEKQNQYGELIRHWRTEKGWSQETLTTKLQVAGWDIDRSLLTLIENGRRPLFDYELKFLLDALGKKLD